MACLGKSLALVLIFVFIASLVTIQPTTVKASSPMTIVVPDEYSDIQTAINHANNGDIVFVKVGTYYVGDQELTINKSISLIGENSQNTIITKNFHVQNFPAPEILDVTSSNVRISNLTITNNQSFDGIRVENGALNVNVFGNNIMNNVVGVNFGGGTSGTISQNNITDNRLGINPAVNTEISNNALINNIWGMILHSSKNVLIKQNQITGSYIGLELSWYGNYYIYQNNITGCTLYGVSLTGANNCTFVGNNLINNAVGIGLINFIPTSLVPLGAGNIAYENNFQNNGKNALIQQAYVYGNGIIDTNNSGEIIGNGTDVFLWDNGQTGNYWSDYNSQGAYQINNLNSDYFPVSQPIDTTSITPPPTPTPVPTSKPTSIPTPTPSPSLMPTTTLSPSPTPIVSEFSWLVVLPLFLSVLFVAVMFRHRKNTMQA